jgi:energy-coupling factor transporter ATP-binding protein EcfA2
MRIDRFRLRNCYGYLNLDVRFNPRLTFLTGINGSGKTTVVRGLVAALTPSFSVLANTQFDEMIVEIEIESGKREIQIRRNAENFEISVSHVEGTVLIPIFKPADYEPAYKFAERESDYYRQIYTSVATNTVVKFLSDLPTPMFLDLERRYQGPRSRRRYVAYDEARAPRPVFGGSLGEGLTEAIDLAEDSYRQFLARQQAIMNTLRRELILAAFASVGPDYPFSPGFQLPDRFKAGDLIQQRRMVSGMLESLDISDPQIERFFDEVDQTLRTLAGRDVETLVKDASGQQLIGEWLRVQPQLAQIARIVKIVEHHNDRMEKAKRGINKFLELINRFLADGGKRLEFQSSGQLRVFYRDTPLKGVAGLSSGERQLVVILTHLAFNPLARKANVLIIDEPELSLHVKWQEMFVGALEAANSDIQYILATHSPSIILDRVGECVDVGESVR